MQFYWVLRFSRSLCSGWSVLVPSIEHPCKYRPTPDKSWVSKENPPQSTVPADPATHLLLRVTVTTRLSPTRSRPKYCFQTPPHPLRTYRLPACSDNDFSHKKGKQTVFRLDSVSDPRLNERKIRNWRCGRILMRAGKLVEIQHRLLCGNVSVAEVWLQAKFGRRDDDYCWLDYHQPVGMPSFLTLDYIRTGTLASYNTFIGAYHILGEIARIRSSVAVVAHVTNRSISDRLMMRHGWEQHMQHMSGRHWIRRFYDGYPNSHIEQFVNTPRDVLTKKCKTESLSNTNTVSDSVYSPVAIQTRKPSAPLPG